MQYKIEYKMFKKDYAEPLRNMWSAIVVNHDGSILYCLLHNGVRTMLIVTCGLSSIPFLNLMPDESKGTNVILRLFCNPLAV